MIMGIAGTPTVVGTTAQNHVFQLANDISGLFDTVAVMKVGPLRHTCVAYLGVPFTEVRWMHDHVYRDGLTTMTVPTIASSCKSTVAHTRVNATLAAVTYRTKFLNTSGTHLKFRASPAPGPYWRGDSHGCR